MIENIRERESNAELIRLIAMFMIVLHHMCVHSLYPEVLQSDITGRGWDYHLMLFIQDTLYIGVNLFLLISGFYGIKLKWRSFFNLYTIFAFYMLLSVIWEVFICKTDTIHKSDIYKIILPFSHGKMWFMQCYIGLMLVSPILNIASSVMTKRQFIGAIVLLTITNVYFGDLMNMRLINSGGFSMTHFVYIYLIGRYLKLHWGNNKIDKYRSHYLWIFILLCILSGILSVGYAYENNFMSWYHTFNYNNIFVILMAITFFMFIMSYHFKSKMINWLATSAIAVYLFQSGVLGDKVLLPYSGVYSAEKQFAVWALASAAIYITAIAIDKIRTLIMHPLWAFYDKYIDAHINATLDKYQTEFFQYTKSK